MAKYDVMTTKAINYIEMEYPSLVKYKYKMAIIIYSNKDNIPKNVTVTDLINGMSYLLNYFLSKERQKKKGGDYGKSGCLWGNP